MTVELPTHAARTAQAAPPHPGPPPQGGRVRKGSGELPHGGPRQARVQLGSDNGQSQPRDNCPQSSSLPPPLRGRAGVGGDFGRQKQAQLSQHARDNAFKVFTYFPIPGTEHAVAAALEPSSSMGVLDRFRRLTVLHAIDFNDEATFEAHEINGVGSDRMLSAEPQPGDTPLPKFGPEDSFFFCRHRAQTPRDLVRHNSSPTALPGTIRELATSCIQN